MANNSAVLIRLSIANQNVILIYIMFGSSKFQDFRLSFRVLYEVSIFSSALNSVKKYRNTDLRASAKTVPNRTAVDYSLLRMQMGKILCFCLGKHEEKKPASSLVWYFPSWRIRLCSFYRRLTECEFVYCSCRRLCLHSLQLEDMPQFLGI